MSEGKATDKGERRDGRARGRPLPQMTESTPISSSMIAMSAAAMGSRMIRRSWREYP